MYFEAHFDDACHQEGSLPGWRQEYRQLSRGRYAGEVAALLFPGLSIIRERINVAVEQLYSAPPNALIFHYWPQESGAYHINGHTMIGGMSGLGHSWSGHFAVSEEKSDCLLVVIDPAAFSDSRDVQAGLFKGDARLQAENIAQWLLSLLVLYKTDPSLMEGQMSRLLPDMLWDRLSLLTEHTSAASSQRLNGSAALEIYRQARDAMIAEPQENMTVSALSRAVGSTPRVLRQACLDVASRRLDELLILWRLNGARRDLIAARGTNRRVSDVALDWGFTHWGRFAARYGALFEEMPSRTLKQ